MEEINSPLGNSDRCQRSSGTYPDVVKRAVFCIVLLAPHIVCAQTLIVDADIDLLPLGRYAAMPKDPECDRPTKDSNSFMLCLGGWQRYALRAVIDDRGHSVKDTTALLYSDPQLSGRWHLVMKKLDAKSAAAFGAIYKVADASKLRATSLH
jgi:hypothetical protein